MTTINLAVQPSRRAAYIISDCAWTHPDGRLEKVAGKIISFERFPCAIGVTGNVDPLAVGEACFAIDARNLRTLVKALPAILTKAMATTKQRYPDTQDVFGILKVAAWCARRGRPTGYMIASDDSAAAQNIGTGWSAFQVAEVQHSHGTDVHVSELLGRPCELHDPAAFDPHQDAYALVAAQRRRPQTNITPGCDSGVAYRIGGEVELTEVTRRGVKVWGCGAFPDAIGQPINPMASISI